MRSKLVGLGVVTLALVAGATVWAFAQQHDDAGAIRTVSNPVAAERDDDGDDEVVIALADLPAPVRAALAGLTADAAVTQVAKEEENGVTTYDVEYTKDGKQWAVEFSADGRVLENEHDDKDDNDR